MRYTLLFFLSASYLLVAFPLRAQQARSASDFVESVGVCTHFDYTNTVYVEQFPRVKELLAELGVRYIRDRAGVNSGGGQALCRELFEEHGIKNVAVFNPRSQRFLVPERIDEMVTRAAAYPQMYAALEGPNEYDNNHPAADTDWVKTLYSFQQRLYRAIKNHPAAVVRRLPVLGPSVTFSRRVSVGEMGDFSGVCDYYNVHAYPGAVEPGRKIDDYLVRVPEVNGPISLYATETGYHTAVAQGPESHYPISEEGEAKYLPRLFMDYFSKGVVKTFTYELLNKQPDPTNTLREENFGLVRNDLTPKPAYYAVKNMLSLLTDGSAETGAATGSLKYTLGGQTEGVKQLLFQKADGKFYLALWREISVWDREAQRDINNPTAAVTLTFDQPVLQTRVYLPYNTSNYSAPLKAVATRSSPAALTLSLPDHLMLVEIDASPAETFTGTYQLLARHSGKALAVDLNSATNGGFANPTADGTNVFQYGSDTYANRLWNIEAVGQGGYYTLTSTYSNRMLAVDLNPTTNGGKQDPTASGTNVFQYGNNTDDNRLWKIEVVAGGYYKLTNKYSGKVLDVRGVSTADGANVQQWSYGGGANQQWRFVAAGSTATTKLPASAQVQLATASADASTVAVYPNPVSDRLTVTGERPYQLALHDATGRLLLQQPHPGGTTGLDVSHLPAGMYTLSLAAGGEVLHRYRVVKE